LIQDSLGTREQVLTQFVTSRGAVLALKSNLHVGQTVSIQNLKNRKSAECHVIGVENAINQLHKVELEFTQPQPDFWPVQFPHEKESEGAGETGNGHSQIESSIRTSSATERPGVPAPKIERPASASESVVDPLLTSNASQDPALAQESDIVLALAAPIQRESSLEEPAFHVKSFSASAASMDSVAQFRAANRSASRRKQQLRGISFAGSVAILVCAFFTAKTILHRHPVKLFQHSTAAASETFSVNTAPQPAMMAPETQNAPTAESPTPPEPQPPADTPVANLTASSGGEPITVSNAEPPAEIAVRHGATLSAERKLATTAEDEPIALPLHSAAAMKTGAEIDQVLSRSPHANAVLAPQVLRPARLLSTVRAEYPATARQYRVEGEVVMTVEIDPTGNVSDVKVVSGPPMLRIPATTAVRRWKYQPATYGDKPVPSSVTAKLDFHLR
jgi:TonB family protein